jgi:hypothetical protein
MNLTTRLEQLVIALAIMFCTQQASAQKTNIPMPQNWQQWKQSQLADDKTMVRQFEKMEWWRACMTWGRETRAKGVSRRTAALRDMLINDKTINGIDLSTVRSSLPAVGQTACGVFAVMGQPEKVNYTSRTGSQSSQMVYSARHIYVYTDASADDANGIVRSIQH